jgi:hypothetical protein
VLLLGHFHLYLDWGQKRLKPFHRRAFA